MVNPLTMTVKQAHQNQYKRKEDEASGPSGKSIQDKVKEREKKGSS